MTLARHLLQSYREFQQSWDRLADRAFGQAAPGVQDEMARGEFISAFISERGLTFPSASSSGDARR